jgi:hypothetical protein
MLSRLNLWWLSRRPWHRWMVVVTLLAMIAIGARVAWGPTASRALTDAEIKGLAQWVELTGEPAVARAYVERQREGRLTVADARAIMEVAKAYGPGSGLAGPGDAAY